MPYLRHAASCHSCSDLLAETLDADETDATPEEEAFLQQLTTSSSTGQHRLAAMMFAATRPVVAPVKTPRKFLSWPVMTLAAAAALLVAGFVAVPMFRQGSDDHLIAKAYDHNRLSELRIPGSSAVELASPTRGAGKDDLASDLLELKLNARKQFDKTPNDPALRQKLGEIAIVEHDGEAARRQFEMAEALNPNLPRLKFDMANAYFELAETNNRPLDYARAIDFFGQYLQSVQQKDPVALFDRGLCWERQAVSSEAIKDFEAALALEKDAGWRKEIQRHIDKLKAQSALDIVNTPYTPAALLALTTESPGDYENFLDAAGREWLPRRNEPETAAALQRLAAIGAQHRDLWLHDFLASPAVPSGDGALSEALQASARSDVDRAHAASALAATLYQKGHNVPGALRARAEHIYSLQRMGRAGKVTDCLDEALPLDAGGQLAAYAWIDAFNKLEIDSCQSWAGRNSAAANAGASATQIAREANLPILGLRAAGFLSATKYASGEYATAWASGAGGLTECYQVRGTFMRRYQFLDDMESVASALDLKWTKAGLAEAAADAAQKTSNLQIAAYALESDGLNHLAIGDTTSTKKRFREADELVDRIGDGPTTKIYRADWLGDRSALVAAERGPEAALVSLAGAENVLRNTTSLLSSVNFYSQYGDLLRRSGKSTDSISAAWRAVADSEKLLAAVQGESQRPTWQDRSSRAYHELVLNLATSDRAEDALRAWEWYRSAQYRHAAASLQNAGSDPATILPPVPAPAASRVSIVYAHLEDHYVGWSVSAAPSGGVQYHVLQADPSTIDHEAMAFSRLCADPMSSTEDIALLGQALDRDLIAPFAAEIDQAETIQFELDSALANIPFAAIRHEGAYLGLTHPLVFLPAGWPVAHGNSAAPNSIAGLDTLPNDPRVLVIRQTNPVLAARIPDEYDETTDIAHTFRSAQVRNASLERSGENLSFYGATTLRSEMNSADLMHYTGHGLDENSMTHAPSLSSAVLGKSSMLRCRIAVLAACRTLDQRNDSAENVASFSRILLDAGASHVLATQWDVDSRMTHTLMIRFYSELANHQTFSEALRRAQQSLQSDSESTHPYYWSAFQLVGQPKIQVQGKL
jgi:CHAT domain-containing protein